jgi:hypothetical protein
VNSDHPDDAGLAFGKHEHHRKSGHNTHCKMSNKRYKRSEVMDHALKQFDRLFEKLKKYYTVNGRSPGVYYGAECANARGKAKEEVPSGCTNACNDQK